MNQILEVKKNINHIQKKVLFYKKIFFLFLFTTILLNIYLFTKIDNLIKKEKVSKILLDNYYISNLYNGINNNINSNRNINNNYIADFQNFSNLNEVFCIIKIPKINIKYPVLNVVSKENLQISPIKFSGKNLTENSNICIAGHNYSNGLFFSDINKLNIGDEIYLYNNSSNILIYIVYDIYEVNSNNLSPIEDQNRFKELTLVTCNNFNNNRIIVKAKIP